MSLRGEERDKMKKIKCKTTPVFCRLPCVALSSWFVHVDAKEVAASA